MKNQITKADFRLQNEVTMFEKMTFQNQDEKDDFEKYRYLKGDDLYHQIYRILIEKTDRVRYATVRAYIRYDKNLREKLYIYLATLEEYCKAQLLRFYDVKTSKKYERHCYDKLMADLVEKEFDVSTLYYCLQPDFGDLMRVCQAKGICEINDDDQKDIKDLRNKTMHHSLLLFGNVKNEKELYDHFSTLEKRLNSFATALPQEYRKGFLSDIEKLNYNSEHNTKHLSKYYLEVQDGRICVKK